MKIDWIFFDVGSTLVNESRAYEHRIKDIVNGTNVTYEEFYNKAIEQYKQGFGSLATPSIEAEMPDYTAESLEDICDIFLKEEK